MEAERGVREADLSSLADGMDVESRGGEEFRVTPRFLELCFGHSQSTGGEGWGKIL